MHIYLHSFHVVDSVGESLVTNLLCYFHEFLLSKISFQLFCPLTKKIYRSMPQWSVLKIPENDIFRLSIHGSLIIRLRFKSSVNTKTFNVFIKKRPYSGLSVGWQKVLNHFEKFSHQNLSWDIFKLQVCKFLRFYSGTDHSETREISQLSALFKTFNSHVSKWSSHQFKMG